MNLGFGLGIILGFDSIQGFDLGPSQKIGLILSFDLKLVVEFDLGMNLGFDLILGFDLNLASYFDLI
jgi:hypothetical protein